MYSIIGSAAFVEATFRFSIRLAFICGLITLVGAPQAQASFMNSMIQTPFQGQGAEQILTSNPLSRTGVSRTGSSYNAQAQTFIGTNKAFSSGSVQSPSAQLIWAESNWEVNSDLVGPLFGATVPLLVKIDYDFYLSAASRGAATFELRVLSDSMHRRFYARTTTSSTLGG